MNKIVYIVIIPFLLSFCTVKDHKKQSAENESAVNTERLETETGEKEKTASHPARSENKQKTKTGQKNTGKNASRTMSVEKYCKLNLEEAKLLMETYWYKFKGKDYEEVKGLFDRYKKESNAILQKNGIRDKRVLIEWTQKNKKKIKQCWKEHPEYDVYKIYPEFESANAKIHELAQKDAAAKK